MVFRFDDTNPAKENHAFEQVILEDVKLLGCEYDFFTRTSDHFEKLLQYCEEMIRLGKAYADDTEAEEMKKQRDSQLDSKNRNNSKDKALLTFLEDCLFQMWCCLSRWAKSGNMERNDKG